MATATPTKRKKRVKKATLKNTLNDLNIALINSSEELIENTVTTGEKYQKLFAKTLKKSEPIVEKQVDIMFDTIEGLKDQLDHGTVRFKKLIGWDDKAIAKLRKNATKSIKSFRKNAEEKIDTVQHELNELIPAIPAPVKVKKVPVAKTIKAKKVTRKNKVTKTANLTKTVKTADLKVINGIGPKMEQILKAGGIKTITALSKVSVAKLEKAIDQSGSNFRAINPESWIAQAKKMNK